MPDKPNGPSSSTKSNILPPTANAALSGGFSNDARVEIIVNRFPIFQRTPYVMIIYLHSTHRELFLIVSYQKFIYFHPFVKKLHSKLHFSEFDCFAF